MFELWYILPSYSTADKFICICLLPPPRPNSTDSARASPRPGRMHGPLRSSAEMFKHAGNDGDDALLSPRASCDSSYSTTDAPSGSEEGPAQEKTMPAALLNRRASLLLSAALAIFIFLTCFV